MLISLAIHIQNKNTLHNVFLDILQILFSLHNSIWLRQINNHININHHGSFLGITQSRDFNDHTFYVFPSGYLPGHRGCHKISDMLNRVEVAKFCPHAEDNFFQTFGLKQLIHFSFGSHMVVTWHTVQLPSSSKTDGRHKCITQPMESWP